MPNRGNMYYIVSDILLLSDLKGRCRTSEWRSHVAEVVQRHAVSRWPIGLFFIIFFFIHNIEIKENDRRKSEVGEKRKWKWLAQILKRLAELVIILLRCWLADPRGEWHHMHMLYLALVGRGKGENTWFVDDRIILMCHAFRTIERTNQSHNAILYITQHTVYRQLRTESAASLFSTALKNGAQQCHFEEVQYK